MDIEKVLRQRGQLNLNKFQLDIPFSYGIDEQVNNLIRYAVSCNVQNLDLVIACPFDDNGIHYAALVLDKFLFINSSFTHMKLDGCVLDPTGAISWTNIKSLCIELRRLDESLIRNILSGSPLLETLKLQGCGGFREIGITSRSVKNLVISGYRDKWDHVVDATNPRTTYNFEINAPHILSLTIEEELSSYIRKIVLLNVSSLVEATLDYYSREAFYYERKSEEEKEEILNGLILSLRHVKKLKIGNHCIKTLARLEAKSFTFPSNMEHPGYVSSSIII